VYGTAKPGWVVRNDGAQCSIGPTLAVRRRPCPKHRPNGWIQTDNKASHSTCCTSWEPWALVLPRTRGIRPPGSSPLIPEGCGSEPGVPASSPRRAVPHLGTTSGPAGFGCEDATARRRAADSRQPAPGVSGRLVTYQTRPPSS